MNNRIPRLLPVMLSASILLSGCADNTPVESETKALTVSVETTAETTAVTTTEITTEEIQEVPYMEQFKDTIVELTPEEYEEKSESITYPVFKKYTYYSSTAERDTNVNVLLQSRRGFISKITTGDSIMLFSFPKRYMNTPYFIPIVSAVLRSDETIKAAVHLGETVFGVSLENHSADNFAESLCRFISELGIYVAVSEIDIAVDELSSDINVDEQITEMYCSLAEKNTPRSTEAYSEIFSNLRKEMKYSPQSNWSVSEAALRTGLSGSHFQRLYKKHFGVSFTEELITFRMDRATYLLRNTSIPVQRIAEECGYTNPAHFMRQFREREGMSAGQYRKAEKNE